MRAELEIFLLVAFARKEIVRVVISVYACVGVLFVILVTLDVPVVKFFRLPCISGAFVGNAFKKVDAMVKIWQSYTRANLLMQVQKSSDNKILRKICGGMI